jgi:hypothetical protein
MIYHLEGSLASSATPEVSVTRTSFRRRLRHIAPVAWIYDVEVTSYVYVFAPDTSQLRGRHQLRSGGLATVIRQVLAPQSWAGSYGQLAWSWLSDVPFSSSCTSTWMPLKVWTVSSLPLADFIAPADCSSWELRLRQLTALGGTDNAVAPGGRRHHRLFLSR